MIKIQDGQILYKGYDETEYIELGFIKDAEVMNGCLFINGKSLPLNAFPELGVEWTKLYPNGKPSEYIPEIVPPSQVEQLEARIVQLEAESLAMTEMNIMLYEMLLNPQGGN